MYAYDPINATWFVLANAPRTRTSIVPIIAANGKIYIIGGQNSKREAITNIDIYDPVTNIWSTSIQNAPFSDSSSKTVLNDKIYCLSNQNLYIFNVRTNTWESKLNVGVGADKKLDSERNRIRLIIYQPTRRNDSTEILTY